MFFPVQGQLDGADDEPSQSLAENIDAVEGACNAPQSEQEPCVQHKAKLRRKRKTREIEVSDRFETSPRSTSVSHHKKYHVEIKQHSAHRLPDMNKLSQNSSLKQCAPECWSNNVECDKANLVHEG